MKIQSANSSDLESIIKLVSEVSDHDVLPLLSAEGKIAYKDNVLTNLKTTLDNPSFNSIKAIESGAIIGFGALRDNNYLTHLFVSKSAQGRGLGKRLLAHLLDSTDAKQISLRSSINAVTFYENNHFVVSGKESEFNGIRFVPMILQRT